MKRRYEEAIRCFDAAIKLDPDYLWPHAGKGISLYFLDRDEESIECFDAAIIIDPDDARPHSNKGDSLHYLKRYDEAMPWTIWNATIRQ